MHTHKKDIPTKIDVPGAVARQLEGFGDATGFGTMGAEYFSLGAGTDIAPLLQGLEDDACQAPHWGFVLSGAVVVSYTGGRPEETCSGDDLFYWPPGHSVRVAEDAELILFSPQVEHTAVMDHILEVMAG